MAMNSKQKPLKLKCNLLLKIHLWQSLWKSFPKLEGLRYNIFLASKIHILQLFAINAACVAFSSLEYGIKSSFDHNNACWGMIYLKKETTKNLFKDYFPWHISLKICSSKRDRHKKEVSGCFAGEGKIMALENRIHLIN